MSRSDAIEEMFALFADLNDKDAISRACDALYAEDAFFEDPINRAEGRAAIARMWLSMGKAFSRIDGRISRKIEKDDQLVVEWEMDFAFRGWPFVVTLPGVTWLVLDGDGRIRSHVDHWDALAFFRRMLPIGKPVARFLPAPLQKWLV